MNYNLATNTLVIVPTYNEAENIEPLVHGIFQACPAMEILFVDDNSQDGTQEHITRCQYQYANKVHLLSRPSKLGLGTAYIAGFRWTLARHYTAVIGMDADLSHNPLYLHKMLSLLEKWDAVFGSRYISGGGTRNWSLWRQVISRSGSLYARLLLGVPIYDLTGGFNAWHRRVLEAINLNDIRSEGYAFQIELKYRVHRAGFVWKEMPIVFVDRRVGQSKMSGRIVREAIIHVWRLCYREWRQVSM
jgi:dolichol-phosphate mannosyltransferase